MIRFAKATAEAAAVFFIASAVGFIIVSGLIGVIRLAYGEEAAGPRWVTVVTIEMKTGHVLKVGYSVSFKSKEECQANQKTDERILTGVTKMMAVAASQGDKVKSIECELDDSGEHV